MGIFTGIGMVTPDASRYKKAIRGLENMRARQMVNSANDAIARQAKDKPRQQAQLKQGMFARGLGKSTIFDQDKGYLDMVQAQKDEELKNALWYARKYKTMIKRKHHWEKISQYYEMIDGIIGLAAGGSGSSSMSYGDGAAQGGGFGASGGSYYTGGAGAAGGGSMGAYYGGY